jgi:hypothetical protein
LKTAIAIMAVCGTHTCALMTTGGVRCWGDAENGVLGDENPYYFTPTAVPGSCQ